METVQLQCGSCMNMMAISTEHLGQQVQCPHCRAVVQTPPASAFGAPPPGPDPVGASSAPQYNPPPQHYAPQPYAPPSPDTSDHPESIFGEAPPSDDLFEQTAKAPRIHMPEERHVQVEHVHTAVAEEEEVDEGPEEEPADLSAMRARLAAARKSSNMAPTILVFLVPYAICCTGFIAYLLYLWPTIDRFDYLPDPKTGKQRQGVAVPAFNSPLSAKRRVPIGETLRIGDLEVTPTRVLRAGNDLQMEFRAKNVSSNVTMTPIELDFVKYNPKTPSNKPYSYLEPALSSDGPRVFGGYVEYFDRDVQHERANGEIGPGQEELIRMSTEQSARGEIEKIRATGRYLWRLQVRRGFVPYRGGEIPVTAIIGIEFSEGDIKSKGV